MNIVIYTSDPDAIDLTEIREAIELLDYLVLSIEVRE